MKYMFRVVFLLIICIPFSMAINIKPGEDYKIHTVDMCKGNIEVYDLSTNTTEDYSIKNCIRTNNLWNCDCEQTPFDIILIQNLTYNKKYDFYIKYYLDRIIKTNSTNNTLPTEQDLINLDNTREYSYDGINVIFMPIKEKLVMPPMNNIFGIFTWLGIIIVIFLVVIALIIIKLFGSDKTDDEISIKDMTEEERNEYLKKCIK